MRSATVAIPGVETPVCTRQNLSSWVGKTQAAKAASVSYRPGFRPREAGRRVHRGTSLVEVLIAMVILLLGIFSLVRLFPTGFTTILYGRSVSMANALMHGMVERAASNEQNLPDAVIAFNPVTLTNFPSLPIAD